MSDKALNYLNPALPAEPLDRLDPENLRQSAEWLLEHNADHIALVADLLKTIRENDEAQEAIRRGYSESHRRLEERHQEVCAERNDYREAIRAVKHAVRDLKVGRL